MIFDVDTNGNEDSLARALSGLPMNLTVQRKRLDVGDVMVTYQGGRVVFERKTWADLRSSIIDSRAFDQKARLKKFVEEIHEVEPEERVRLIYVIQVGVAPPSPPRRAINERSSFNP